MPLLTKRKDGCWHTHALAAALGTQPSIRSPGCPLTGPPAHGRTGPHGYQREEPPGTKVPSAPVPSMARRGREGQQPLHPGRRSPLDRPFQNWTLGTCFLMAGFCAPHGINPTRLGSVSWHQWPWVFCLPTVLQRPSRREGHSWTQLKASVSSNTGCDDLPTVTSSTSGDKLCLEPRGSK